MDVQIGPQLVEEAPQELRSRLWLALIDNPQLCHTYDEGKVEQHESDNTIACCLLADTMVLVPDCCIQLGQQAKLMYLCSIFMALLL